MAEVRQSWGMLVLCAIACFYVSMGCQILAVVETEDRRPFRAGAHRPPKAV